MATEDLLLQPEEIVVIRKTKKHIPNNSVAKFSRISEGTVKGVCRKKSTYIDNFMTKEVKTVTKSKCLI